MAAISGRSRGRTDGGRRAARVLSTSRGGGILRAASRGFGDSACNPQNATDVATKAWSIDRVIAVVGWPARGAVLASGELGDHPCRRADDHPSGTSPEIPSSRTWTSSTAPPPSDDYQGRALARTPQGARHLQGGGGLPEQRLRQRPGRTFPQGRVQEPTALASPAIPSRGGARPLRIQAGHAFRARRRRHPGHLRLRRRHRPSILRQALENNFFKTFVGADGMKSGGLVRRRWPTSAASSSRLGGEASASLDNFNKAYKAAGENIDAVVTTTSYDAVPRRPGVEKGRWRQSANSPSRCARYSAPGEPILAGEWAKAKQLIAEGGDIIR